MPEYAFLIGFVVIRSDDQRRVSPSGSRRLHMLKRGHGVVRSAPGDYRDTSRSLRDEDFYDAIMFLNGHVCAFPRGSPGHKRSAVLGALPVDTALRPAVGRIGQEWGHSFDFGRTTYTENKQ